MLHSQQNSYSYVLSFPFYQHVILCRDVKGTILSVFLKLASQHLLNAAQHAVYLCCKLEAFPFKNCINESVFIHTYA